MITEQIAASRLAEMHSQIAAAVKLSSRTTETICVIAVSKTYTADAIMPFILAGQRHFGENKVQEAQAKWPSLRATNSDICLHMIGQLQSNKAAEAVALFDIIHSVDRLSLIAALDKAQKASDIKRDYFIQVNIGDEAQKGGCTITNISSLLTETRRIGLNVIGLMAVPPANVEPAPYFALLHKLTHDHGLSQVSMGMSSDYATAIMLGATHVRIGTALFGDRSTLSDRL